MSLADQPQHLNTLGCRIRHLPGKGRGVYASQSIQQSTVVDISPVLLFAKDEYEKYGRHTILENYTLKWPDGQRALALGLGSLFNHSEHPNVTYKFDTSTNSIRYTSIRDINPDEELTILYGHNLRLSPAQAKSAGTSQHGTSNGPVNGVITVNGHHDNDAQLRNPDSDSDEEVIEEDLPFVRWKPPPDEEDMESVRTIKAWVVDVPDPRWISRLLKWLKDTKLEDDSLAHLKRVRKLAQHTTFLICESSIALPAFPPELDLNEPYRLEVPTSSALTPASLILKSSLWPTLYTPRRKGELDAWSKMKVRWAERAVHFIVQEAIKALDEGELPIVAYVPPSFDSNTATKVTGIAHDTRNSLKHPLRHAAMNVIRRIADENLSRAQSPTPASTSQNGSGGNYLLTAQSVFLTHEPCVMCSMALLHSRVKEVFYLIPMPLTGGCGGATSLPALPGVNHRYGISRWRIDSMDLGRLQIDSKIDA